MEPGGDSAEHQEDRAGRNEVGSEFDNRVVPLLLFLLVRVLHRERPYSLR